MMLTQQELDELVREAARRGSKRRRELSEHVREAYATGPKAVLVTTCGKFLRGEGNIEEHVRERYSDHGNGPRTRRRLRASQP